MSFCSQCALHLAEVERLQTEVDAAHVERDAWRDMALQGERNIDYYRGLVVQIGEAFGVDAYLADDGGLSQDVLCAKVPELVAALRTRAEQLDAQVAALRGALADVVAEYSLVIERDYLCADHTDPAVELNFKHDVERIAQWVALVHSAGAAGGEEGAGG